MAEAEPNRMVATGRNRPGADIRSQLHLAELPVVTSGVAHKQLYLLHASRQQSNLMAHDECKQPVDELSGGGHAPELEHRQELAVSKWRLIPREMGVFTVWWLWLLILGIPTLWLLVGIFEHFGVLDKESPDWVQAVGSIAAVFAAVLVANRQGQQQVRERQNKDRVVSHLVVGVATRAAAVSSLLFRSFNDLQQQVKETNEEILTTVESQVLALRGINPVDLPRPEMVEPFLRIRAAMEQSHVMANLLANGRDGYVDRLRCATAFAHNSQAVHKAAEELQQAALI